MIQAEEHLQCKKHDQTGQWSVDLMPITAHKGDLPSDVFVLSDSQGQGTTQIYLAKISTYVGFKCGLFYRIETSGISLKQQKYMNCYHNTVLKDG